jgi:hypothetical protein
MLFGAIVSKTFLMEQTQLMFCFMPHHLLASGQNSGSLEPLPLTFIQPASTVQGDRATI